MNTRNRVRTLEVMLGSRVKQKSLLSSLAVPFLAVVVLGLSNSRAEPSKELINFKKDPKVKMGITDDGVMGGLSKGQMKISEEGNLLFSGTLSLQNNGGFSSLRMDIGRWNLEGWQGIEVKVKGDGRTYDLRVTTDERFRRSPISFRGKISTEKGKWTTVKVSFSELKGGWRGMTLKNEFDPAKIETIGITVADKKEGLFELEVESIKAWK